MTRDKITYEWAVESCDEHGDNIAVNHADSYAEALRIRDSEAPDYDHVDIALTRIEGNDDDGINWRGYAYVRDGALESCFSTYHPEGIPANDGPDVPKRFHEEVAR